MPHQMRNGAKTIARVSGACFMAAESGSDHGQRKARPRGPGKCREETPKEGTLI